VRIKCVDKTGFDLAGTFRELEAEVFITRSYNAEDLVFHQGKV
jgi:hypothetical protein